MFSLCFKSLAYITLPKNKRKTKINGKKKLIATYTLCLFVFHAFVDIETIPGKEKICQRVPVPMRDILS